MTQLDERSAAGLRIVIDRDLCVGFGDCVHEAPDVFELDDENVAVYRDSVDEADRETILRAVRACPVDALAAYEGDRLVAP